jgi:hypothetical protein
LAKDRNQNRKGNEHMQVRADKNEGIRKKNKGKKTRRETGSS